ncbi:C-type lectin domain family 4 member M [Nematolebias whitei]|uniref:C-type lectin domain family 4 member M n=1 Tax=Nematolebias whitei TaxID=451745 RepID=UPI001899A0BC|nr:C-type lectin domain family 4 member M [Nematolebias whitei]
MAVEYHASTKTNMDIDDCKIAYKQFFSEERFLSSVNALRNRPFKIASVCLGVLCVLLVAGVIGQSVHYQNVGKEHQNNLNTLSTEKENLQQNLKMVKNEKTNLEVVRDQLQQRNDRITRSNDQLQKNVDSLIKDKRQLQMSESQLQASETAAKNTLKQLNSTNAQLQKDKDVLSTAQKNLQTQYDSVVKRKKELQSSYNSVTTDRDNLQNKFNNATRSREQLQLSYNKLIQKVEDLQDSFNFSTSEKDKIASSHQNLTTQMKLLQETCNTVKKAEKELRASYGLALSQKQEAESVLKNVVAERDELKIQTMNLTVERQQLLETINRLNTSIQDKKCPAGWRKFQYSCYYTSLIKKTWNLSREDCQTKGADLAIITSQEEMNFINRLYSSDKEVWIGLTDGGVEGQWKWVDGNPLNLTFWAKGQPNSHQGRNQDCAEFWHRATGNGDWNDENCGVEQYWICEK